MADDIEIKARILTITQEMFLKFGYSRVTMKDIASNAGISKKTLYKFFLNKEDLVRVIMFKMKCSTQECIDDILSNNEMDFVEKLEKLMNLIRILSSKFKGPLLEDLHKNIPELWRQINEFENENVNQKITQLIDIGIEKGIFRKDIDHRLIFLIYLSAVKGLINYETLAQIPFTDDQVYESIIKIIFTGIFSESIINKNLIK